MKIITILSLCLTASLSFANSEILDKTKDDAFTYDYSNICEIEYSPFSLDVIYANIYGLNIPYQNPDHPISIHASMFITEPNFHLDYAKRVIRKLKSSSHRYGFPSKTDANAFFNIQILNNSLNSQLGYLRWITELAHRATNDNTIDIQVSKNSHLINFGTQIIESLIFVSIQNPFCTTQFKPCSTQIIDTIIIQPGLKPKPKRVIHDF